MAIDAGIKKITLKKVVMKGFRRFKDKTEICFNDSKAIIPAANKQGKTTISEAILWTFLGVNLEGNDKADKFLMNRDSNEMMVQVEFIDERGYKQVLERTRIDDETTITINGNKFKQKELLYALGSRKEFLLMALNLDYFFKLSEKQMRDFFVSLLPEIDSEDILNSLTQFEADVISQDLEKINADPNGYLKERRTELTTLDNDITRLKGKLEGLKPSKEGIPTKKTFDNSKLEDLEKQYDEILSLKPDTKSIETKLENFQKQKNIIEQEIAVVQNSVVNSELKDDKELLKKKLTIQKQINELENKQYNKIKEEEILNLSTKIKYLREQYKKEREMPIQEGMTCPTCKHTVGNEDISHIKKVISGTLNDIKNQADAVNVKLDKLKNEEELNHEKFINETTKMLDSKKKELIDIDKEILKIEQHNTAILKDFENSKSVKLNNLNKKISDISKVISTFEKTKKDIEIAFEKEISSKKEKLKTLLKAERELKQKVESNNTERALKIKTYNETVEKYKATANQIKDIEQEISKLNLKISATKNYNQKNAELLAELINNSFDKLTVSLYKIVQSTGEIKSCFELFYEGENLYSLSNARSQKMRIALEIYDFIVKTTGLQYPLYLDNAESIDDYETIAHQIIETRVAPGQKIITDFEDASRQLEIA